MTKCTACARGPVGGEGHSNLFVMKMCGHEVQFICRGCRTLWVRRRNGDVDQWWETTRELEAVTLPGTFLETIRHR